MTTHLLPVAAENHLFICSFTQKIFQHPILLSPCGHHVEAEEADRVYYLQDEDDSDNACPCCKEKVVSVREDPFFCTRLDLFLAENPSLEKERYCSAQEVLRVIRNRDPFRWKLLANSLARSGKLNAVMPEYQGLTLLALIIAFAPERGMEFLLKYRKVANTINGVGLNALSESGESALYFFARANGYSILSQLNLESLITENSLNHLSEANNDSALYWILEKSNLMALALRSSILEMIRPMALNALTKDNRSSPLLILCHDNPSLLLGRKGLIAMIEEPVFNASNHQGLSPLNALRARQAGIEVLQSHPVLIAMSNSPGLKKESNKEQVLLPSTALSFKAFGMGEDSRKTAVEKVEEEKTNETSVKDLESMATTTKLESAQLRRMVSSIDRDISSGTSIQCL